MEGMLDDVDTGVNIIRRRNDHKGTVQPRAANIIINASTERNYTIKKRLQKNVHVVDTVNNIRNVQS